jgi:hypothetical protein
MSSQPLRALFAQGLGLVIAISMTWLLPGWQLNGWRLAGLQAISAALFALALRQPSWWLPMHLLFAPCLAAALSLQVPAPFYLAGFLFMLLVFWGTARGDAPLYLSSAAVAETLAALARQEQATTFAELGAGIGSVVVPLAQRLPAMQINAWERAPLPWALLAWRCRGLSQVTANRSNFWRCNLSSYDVVFAFLSPLPMRQLGEKARREMRPGSMLVSSVFPVPGWKPDSVLQTMDKRKTHLYCYRIAGKETS